MIFARAAAVSFWRDKLTLTQQSGRTGISVGEGAVAGHAILN
jgi:hypothetical protein